MGNLTDNSKWEAGIYQLEKSDRVEGGPGGKSNVQAQQLANRTAYLRAKLDNLVAAAPDALDTFAELAAAIKNDKDFGQSIIDHLAKKSDKTHDHDGVYEPLIKPKNTAFNKNFGAANGEVARGDHLHDDRYRRRTDFTFDWNPQVVISQDVGGQPSYYYYGSRSSLVKIAEGSSIQNGISSFAVEVNGANGISFFEFSIAAAVNSEPDVVLGSKSHYYLKGAKRLVVEWSAAVNDQPVRVYVDTTGESGSTSRTLNIEQVYGGYNSPIKSIRIATPKPTVFGPIHSRNSDGSVNSSRNIGYHLRPDFGDLLFFDSNKTGDIYTYGDYRMKFIDL